MALIIITDEEISQYKEGGISSFPILYDKFKPFFEKCYTEFKFIPNEIYNEITNDILLSFVNNYQINGSNNFFEQFEMQFSDLVYQNIKGELVDIPEIINNYLQMYSKKNNKLDTLADFLTKCFYEEDIDTTIAILENNQELLNEIDKSLKKMRKLTEETINKKYPNELKAHIIKMYCLLNNIDITGELLDDELDKFDDESYEEKNNNDERYGKEKYNYDEIDSLPSAINLYFADVHYFSRDILSHEEVIELCKKYENGDQEAFKKLVVKNLLLVPIIAKRYFDKGLSREDIIQEGNIGLINGITKFDYRKGFKLSSYVNWWIRQNIKRALDNYGRTIRIPVDASEQIYKMRMYIANYTNLYEKEPSDEEIAQTLKISLDRVRELNSYMEPPLSLNYIINNEDDSSELGEFIPDDRYNTENTNDLSAMQRDVRNLLFNKVKLKEKERMVLLLRNGFYGNIWTLEACGKLYGVTRERARQIEARALRKLRDYRNIQKFLVYMDDAQQATKALEYAKSQSKHISISSLFEYSDNLKNNNNVEDNRDKYDLFNYLQCLDDRKFIIYDIIETLDDEDKRIIVRCCGKSYDGKSTIKTTVQERVTYLNRILPYIVFLYKKLSSAYELGNDNYYNTLHPNTEIIGNSKTIEVKEEYNQAPVKILKPFKLANGNDEKFAKLYNH